MCTQKSYPVSYHRTTAQWWQHFFSFDASVKQIKSVWCECMCVCVCVCNKTCWRLKRCETAVHQLVNEPFCSPRNHNMQLFSLYLIDQFTVHSWEEVLLTEMCPSLFPVQWLANHMAFVSWRCSVAVKTSPTNDQDTIKIIKIQINTLKVWHQDKITMSYIEE